MSKSTSAGRSREIPIDLTDDPPPRPSKRKRGDNDRAQEPPKTPKSSPKKRKTADSSEKRLCVFRSRPPGAFQKVYDRALQQRFYVLKRERAGTDECPEEIIELAGSTGNVYTVHVAKQPTCNCPHALNGNQCKHVLYILSRVLHAPYDLVYQLALLSSELRTIFAAAPPIVAPEEVEAKGRKPVAGDCPICFSELDAGGGAESVVWCRAVCGQNMHKECFRIWAGTRPGAATCPMCRTPWVDGAQGGAEVDVNQNVCVSEGYANVADQLGLSRVRDESTYHRAPNSRTPWYRRRRGRGWEGYLDRMEAAIAAEYDDEDERDEWWD